MSDEAPKPPRTFDEFSRQFPAVRKGWDLLAAAGQEGPLDEKTTRLIKLGIAIGAMREGAVHSSARKAAAIGISSAEMYQAVALAASVIGLPSAVAVYTWIRDVVEPGR